MSRSYEGFLSYAHGDDYFAAAIQDGVEQIARPWLRRERLRLFRDSTGLAASPDLWGDLVAAMDTSDRLIVLCSERLAESEWADREVRYWLDTKGAETILLAHLDGRLTWSDDDDGFDDSATTSLCPALLTAFDDEPPIIDLRSLPTLANQDSTGSAPTLRTPGFAGPIAELAGVLQGKSASELVEQEERQLRRRLGLTVASAVVLGVSAIAGVVLLVTLGRLGGELRDERDAAVARRFAIDARLEALTAPDLAAGYALASWELQPDSEESGAALLNAAQLFGRYRLLLNDDRPGIGITSLAGLTADRHLVGWSDGEVTIVDVQPAGTVLVEQADFDLADEVVVMETIESGDLIVVDGSGQWRRVDADLTVTDRGAIGLDGHEIRRAAVHESGRWLAFVRSDTTLGIQQLTPGALVQLGGTGVSSVDLLDDLIIAGTPAGVAALRFGATETAWQRAVPASHLAVNDSSRTIAVLEAGQRLVTLDEDGEVLNQQGQQRAVFGRGSALVAHDGGFFAAGIDGQVIGWSADGELASVQGVALRSEPTALIAVDGRWILGTAEGELITDQPADLNLVDPPGQAVVDIPGVTTVSSSDDPSTLLVGATGIENDYRVTLSMFDVDTGELLTDIPRNGGGSTPAVISGGQVFIASRRGIERSSLEGPWTVVSDDRLDGMIPGPNGGIIGLRRGGSVTSYDQDGNELFRYDAVGVEPNFAVHAVTVSQDHDLVAVSWAGRSVDVFRLSDLAPVTRIGIDSWSVTHLAVLDAGSLAIVDAGNRLSVYDLETSQVIAGSRRPLTTEVDFLFPAGDDTLAAVSQSRGLVYLDLAGRPLSHALGYRSLPVLWASTAGDVLHTSHHSGAIVRWELDYGRIVTQLCAEIETTGATVVDQEEVGAELIAELAAAACVAEEGGGS